MVSDAHRGSEILYHRADRNGAIWAEIELNRPDKANALTMTMIAARLDLERGDCDRAVVRAEQALAAAEVVGRRTEIALALAVLARAAQQVYGIVI